MADPLQERLGQPVVVENKAGAGGAIGGEATAKAPADGHTLLITGSGAVTVSPHLNKLSYDPLKDLAPVTMVATLPIVVAVHPSLPVRSIAELVAYAKAQPGKLNFSSNGLGSVSFLAAELLKKTTGIEMVHVVYRGAAPGAAAVAAGEVQVGFIDSTAIMPQARAGAVRALAVTDPQRSNIVPDLPTVAESGVAGYAVRSWVGLFAPRATPADVVARLNTEVTHVLRQPAMRERMLQAQMEPAPGTVDEFARYVTAETETWRDVIKSAGIKGN
jgi:tripartite-type tricarboxylate transporter receptor subunit TctC